MYNVFKKCNNGTQIFFFIVKVSTPALTACSVKDTWDSAQGEAGQRGQEGREI